jgi:cardiolipin synthase
MVNELFPQISKHNQLELLLDGAEYCDKYLELIREAEHSIHLQTYIFHMDEFGSCVHKELINAARRGVKVYLLIDSVGSRFFEETDEMTLRESGVYFCRFNGIKWDWFYRWGRRLHHKVLIIDQIKSIIGGINIISPCVPGSIIPKLDFAIYMEGIVNKNLTYYCQTIFKTSYKKNVHFENLNVSYSHHAGSKIEISVNDWVHRRRRITKQYYELTAQAKNEIIIVNSYFFPRRKFMKKLVDAAQRGVKVSLILPKYSDWPSYIMASEYLYEYFL